MKHRFLFALILALALLPGAGRAETIRSDMVRLHVVAADDTPAAQALKLKVRDACLVRARALLADCGDAEEAWARVNEGLSDLEEAARSAARDEVVRAETGVYDFPDRVYGDTLVPAGRYRALRVVIGEGQGRNWWCVLYPCLCLPEDCRAGEPVQFHSAVLEWLRRLFGGEGA